MPGTRRQNTHQIRPAEPISQDANWLIRGIFREWEVLTLQDETRQRWLEICAAAAICEDPERLQELTDTINAILKEKKQRLELGREKLRIAV